MAVLEHWRSSWMCPDCPWHSLSCNPPSLLHIACMWQKEKSTLRDVTRGAADIISHLSSDISSWSGKYRMNAILSAYCQISTAISIRNVAWNQAKNKLDPYGAILDKSPMGLSQLCHAWIILIETSAISTFVWPSTDYLFRCNSICGSVSQWMGNIFRFPCQSSQC